LIAMTASLSALRGVFIALGANLPSEIGSPQQTLEVTLQRLQERRVTVVARSPWYASEPVPPSDQPWFINGVAEVATDMKPSELLALLHEIEASLGRVRVKRWEARVVDLDLLDYRGRIDAGPSPILPHPSMTVRAFVLLPLRDIAPHWRDPVGGRDVQSLIEALPPGGAIKKACETA
jgi:2-amino-4-hydroxy-6-hydroxymethyldihydropteridine diphosphokinase